MLRRVLVVLAALSLTAACDDQALLTRVGSGEARLRIESATTVANLSVLVLDVTAPDITTPLVFNIPVQDGVAAGSITVPAGGNRTITIHGFNADGLETHRGSVTLSVLPGTNPTIRFSLQPLTGEQPIDVDLGSIIVRVEPSAPTLAVGASMQLKATLFDADGAPMTGRVSWATLNPAKVVVDSNGLVTARDTGVALVIATYGGAGGSAEVHIGEGSISVASVAIDPATATLVIGATTQLRATATGSDGSNLDASGAVWQSSAPAIASVSASGLVTGLAVGTATMTATVGGQSGTAAVTVTSTSSSVAEPDLPQVFLDTHYVPPTGGTTRTVAAGQDLQAVLNAAQPGDIILLAAGATFTGNFVVPAKSGTAWLVIRSAAADGQLPAEGERITPAYASVLPKLVSPNEQPAFSVAPGAHHIRLLGVEVTAVSGLAVNNGLVELGGAGSVQNQLAQVPHDLVLDRVYVHGSATLPVKRCVTLNSAASAVIDSYLADCHTQGQDSQAILGYNGPGPFKIVNNYLEGAGENVMFGGADPGIANLVPSDIEFRHNYVYKPLSWRGVWTVKNSFELKNAQRVLIEGNIFENNWQDAQAGFAMQLTPVTQSGGAMWSTVRHVTIRYNKFLNSLAGVNISRGNTTDGGHHILLEHNVFSGLSMTSGDGRLWQLVGTVAQITYRHNTGAAATFLMMTAETKTGLVIRDNVLVNGLYGFYGDAVGSGIKGLDAYAPGWIVSSNVLASVGASGNPPDNFYPTDALAIGFVDWLGGNWRLSATSPYLGKASDSTNPGANLDALDSATQNVTKK